MKLSTSKFYKWTNWKPKNLFGNHSPFLGFGVNGATFRYSLKKNNDILAWQVGPEITTGFLSCFFLGPIATLLIHNFFHGSLCFIYFLFTISAFFSFLLFLIVINPRKILFIAKRGEIEYFRNGKSVYFLRKNNIVKLCTRKKHRIYFDWSNKSVYFDIYVKLKNNSEVIFAETFDEGKAESFKKLINLKFLKRI